MEVNSEVLTPILLECFKTNKNPAHLLDIVIFINWLLEEFGIRDTTSISRIFSRYIQNGVFECSGDDEIQVRNVMLMFFFKKN